MYFVVCRGEVYPGRGSGFLPQCDSVAASGLEAQFFFFVRRQAGPLSSLSCRWGLIFEGAESANFGVCAKGGSGQITEGSTISMRHRDLGDAVDFVSGPFSVSVEIARILAFFSGSFGRQAAAAEFWSFIR